MNKRKKILLVACVIVIFIGFLADRWFFGSLWSYTVTALLLSGIIIFSFNNRIIKILDFLYQAIPITLIFTGIALGKIRGQGFLIAFYLVAFTLPYQYFSSIIIAVRQFFKKQLSKTGLLRLILCISIVGLLLLLSVANRNCWSVKDILTFSSREVTHYKEYLAIHEGEPYVTPLCRQLNAYNNNFVKEQLFIFYIVPLFFVLTIIERFLDLIRKRESNNNPAK